MLSPHRFRPRRSHRPAFRPAAALWLILAASGCRSKAVPVLDEFRLPSDGPPAADAQEKPAKGEQAAAIQAIKRGDYEAAHAILGRILFDGHLADARAALADGRPEDALLATEDALKLYPRDADALLLDARGRLALAEKGTREGLPFTAALIQDALDASLRAGSSPAARIQAARAASLLGQGEDALRYATEAMTAAAGADIDVDRLPQRTLAEAAYGAYAARKNAGADADATRELFQRTETALTSLLGRAPTDPWVHTTLANLYEWEGNLVEARDALMRGIDRVPADAAAAGMVVQLARVVRLLAENHSPIETFAELVRRHPQLADARWFEAEQRFYDALLRLEAKEFLPGEFRAAEAGFRRCRELNADYAGACKPWETTCRNALGWCLYQTGDIPGAEAAFRSMDELVERGLLVDLPDRLPNGTVGLAFCAQAYRTGENQDLLAAAEVNDHLHGYVPDNPTYANDAGLLLRDAAVQIEYAGRRCCYASQGLIKNADALAALRKSAGIGDSLPAGSAGEREAFRSAANQRIEQARALMKRSADAYRAASALTPDDVRIKNDTALILMYYLHTDIDEAKAMLLRCVELGTRQIEDESLDEDARFNLKSAWGDAHQNLGVLAYIYEHDDASALAWFEKSIAIDADRGDVVDFWLPFLRGELEAADDEDYLAVKDWGKPCE